MSYLLAAKGGGSSSLSDLADVNITSPQDGDILIYDANSSEWINGTTDIQVTLTINSAKEDTVTIKDSNNITIGTCIFGSNKTSGTAVITVPSGGGTYKFISSIAKDTTNGTSNYQKTVTISDSSSTQTVNVMPDGAMYWYGWGQLTGYPKPFSAGWAITPTLTKNTNSISYSASNASPPNGGGGFIYGSHNDTGFTKVKVEFSITYAGDDTFILVYKSLTTTPYNQDSANMIGEWYYGQSTMSNQIISQTFTVQNNTVYAGILTRPSGNNNYNTGIIKRMWLE